MQMPDLPYYPVELGAYKEAIMSVIFGGALLLHQIALG